MGRFSNLRLLDLEENKLETLPNEIGMHLITHWVFFRY